MGLSSDPEKRERQLAGLRLGQEKLAEKVAARKAAASAPAKAAKAPAKAAKAPKPRQAKAAAPRARERPDDDVVTYEETPPSEQRSRERREEPAPRRRGAGFLDGFLGRS